MIVYVTVFQNNTYHDQIIPLTNFWILLHITSTAVKNSGATLCTSVSLGNIVLN
jgi:hypothetical protein